MLNGVDDISSPDIADKLLEVMGSATECALTGRTNLNKIERIK